MSNLPDAPVVPWGYELFKHMDETHGLILTLSELQEIVRLAPSKQCGWTLIAEWKNGARFQKNLPTTTEDAGND